MKEKHIIVRRRARAKPGGTDWQRLAAMSEREITDVAKTDPDAQPTDREFWKNAKLVLPEPRHPVMLRVDKDVLDWFKARGRAISRG